MWRYGMRVLVQCHFQSKCSFLFKEIDMPNIKQLMTVTAVLLMASSFGAQAQTPPGKAAAPKGAGASAKKGAQTNNFGGDEWERKGGVKGAKPASTQGKFGGDEWDRKGSSK